MTAAVLLCAGGSIRFSPNQHKLLAPFRGRPLVSWSLENVLAAGLDEVIVVEGPIELAQFCGDAVRVHNPDWSSGQSSSLQTGIRAASARGHGTIVVGLGDQPFVPPSAWAAVASTASPIAVASFEGQRTPPVRLDRSVWPMLPVSGDVGARELMKARPDLVREVPCQGRFIDVDTADDLIRWS